jgi:flagellar biosynthesis/type III secretory pathway chaperone
MNNLEELEKDIRDMQSLVTLMNSELKELNKEVKEVILSILVKKSDEIGSIGSPKSSDC